MKIKPVLLFTASAIIVVACSFLFSRGKKQLSPESVEVVQYLTTFKKQFPKGLGGLLNYFNDGYDTRGTYEILAVITDLPLEEYLMSATFKVDFNADKTTVKFINPELSIATVPVTFSKEGMAQKYSFVYFTIQKVGNHQYKIYKIDGANLMVAYQNYANYVEENQFADKDVYTPLTIKAFAKAAQLHTRYDSVVWFGQVNGKSWFYVINGKWDVYKALWHNEDSAKTYKMGLVNPQLKEIIPAGFDVVHNIGGTLPNLVEVEKGHKKGLYDLTGKIIVPVMYDWLMPVKNNKNLAVLKKGDDFYWLRNDYTVSGKVNLRMVDVISQLKQPVPFTLTKNPGNDIIEFNSRRMNQSVYLPPAYLADLQLTPRILFFRNPLRHKITEPGSTGNYEVKKGSKRTIGENWLVSIFYNIKEYYLTGRLGFYTAKGVVIIDKKRNDVYGATITDVVDEGVKLAGPTLVAKNNVKALNDSLFEVTAQSFANINLYNKDVLVQYPRYHYFKVNNRRLVEQDSRRQFGFTRYIKMDDSYINGFYVYDVKIGGNDAKRKMGYRLNQDALQYMKNEIYASYNYDFKDAKWAAIFSGTASNYKPKNSNVDDSLTVIDKYNINFINNKLNTMKTDVLAAK